MRQGARWSEFDAKPEGQASGDAWVDVRERLPRTDPFIRRSEVVLIWLGHAMMTAFYAAGTPSIEGVWFATGGDRVSLRPTHWRALPPPPSGRPTAAEVQGPRQAALEAAHGTPAEFATAARAAVPSFVSAGEAEASIRRYEQEWVRAGEQDAAESRLRESETFWEAHAADLDAMGRVIAAESALRSAEG